jgi:hypothetical protein
MISARKTSACNKTLVRIEKKSVLQREKAWSLSEGRINKFSDEQMRLTLGRPVLLAEPRR